MEGSENVPIKMELRGAKGVLSVSNFLDGSNIQLCPSLIQFSSNHYELGIVRFSTIIRGYVNRQAITILSVLGIHDGTFMEKIDRMIELMSLRSDRFTLVLSRSLGGLGDLF